MSATGLLVLSPLAGRGLGEGRRERCSSRRSLSQDSRISIGKAAAPSRPSPNPLPTRWGEGQEHAA
jgi:hypothetical protein